MKKICKKCKKIHVEGVDGYCQNCIKQEQKSVLSKWNDINDEEEDGD